MVSSTPIKQTHFKSHILSFFIQEDYQSWGHHTPNHPFLNTRVMLKAEYSNTNDHLRLGPQSNILFLA